MSKAILLMLLGLLAGCSVGDAPEQKAAKDSHASEAKGEKWDRMPAGQVNGRDKTFLSLNATSSIHVQDKNFTPELNIGCGPGSHVYVKVPATEDRNVRVAFDQSAPVQQKWFVGPDHDVLGPPTNEAEHFFLGQLLGAKLFRLEFTPKGGTPQSVTFNVLDLGDIMNHDTACTSWLTHR